MKCKDREILWKPEQSNCANAQAAYIKETQKKAALQNKMLLLIEAYMELGFPYESQADFFEQVFHAAGLTEDEVLLLKRRSAKKLRLNKSKIESVLGRWNPTGNKLDRFRFKDIIQIYREGKYAVFATKEKVYKQRMSLNDAYKELPEGDFVFIERGIMGKIILYVGIEALNLFLCIYLAYVLLKEEQFTLKQRGLRFFACMVMVILNTVNLPILYYNNVIWIQTDLFLIVFFKCIKDKHGFIRTGIAILIKHLLIYMDYAIGFLLVDSGNIRYSMEIVLYGKRIEIICAFYCFLSPCMVCCH